jgi:predicted GH43/DUF377 family glycosyl hydrolase
MIEERTTDEQTDSPADQEDTGRLRIRRHGIVLRPNPARVYYRPLLFTDRTRIAKIVARVTAMEEQEVEREMRRVLTEFRERHQHLEEYLLSRFDCISEIVMTDRYLSKARKILLGSCFTQEYALEAAALFNPSIVPHPDQSGLPPGALRFILSLRATGEGHISSIVFRQGTISAGGEITVDPPVPYVTQPDAVPDAKYDKTLFSRKLAELGLLAEVAEEVLDSLGEKFTFGELMESVTRARRYDRTISNEHGVLLSNIVTLAEANYDVLFEDDQSVSERVIAPKAPTEINGIEDARFVLFTDDNGEHTYYATYTAFDGKVILPQFLETDDFLKFRISTLNGPEVQNKGLALFPRKVNGRYAMISRQDNENMYLMFSDSLHFWYTKQLLMRPTFPWEYIQLGNCGSPIETEAGWLLITHGVGPMRKYSIGAALLDLEDPSRVIGRLPFPLLSPIGDEREGYVPNVVYSCGSLIHNGRLILPYAMSDQVTGFASIETNELLEELLKWGPLGDGRRASE